MGNLANVENSTPEAPTEAAPAEAPAEAPEQSGPDDSTIEGVLAIMAEDDEGAPAEAEVADDSKTEPEAEEAKEEDEEEDEESENEDEENKSEGKKESRWQRQKRKAREAEERAAAFEKRVEEERQVTAKVRKVLEEAEQDVVEYEAFAVKEQARSQAILEILKEQNVTLSRGDLARIELAVERAGQQVQREVSESLTQARTNQATSRQQQQQAWARSISQTRDHAVAMLGVDSTALSNAVITAAKAGEQVTPQTVIRLAKELAMGTGANATPSGSVPRKPTRAPDVIQPTRSGTSPYKEHPNTIEGILAASLED